jgi:phosphatidylglycerol:prolipoprotein diacylglycerol transferase
VRQTLFYLPYEVAGTPLFGNGWLLWGWITLCLVILGWQWRRHGWNRETRGYLPFMTIVALVIAVVLPRIVVPGQGLPVRGYGVMLLAATVAGVALAVHQARRAGLHPDLIFSLAFSMFVAGIVGARLFFVIQYWHAIRGATIGATVANILNFVEGGLVVYGSLIGALLAGFWFCRRHQIPPLVVADVIAPSLAVGLAIGRIGCLLNGCCYGDVSHQPWAIRFPRVLQGGTLIGSPPYLHQLRLGLLHGFRLGMNERQELTVRHVDPQGPAASAGLAPGERVQAVNGERVDSLEAAGYFLERAGPRLTLLTDKGVRSWSVPPLPERSLPVHPTQLYSSLNAALLGLITFVWYPHRRRDGEVFALLITLYAITRFVLEMIRTDEGAFFAGLTISQNVSVLMLAGAAALWLYILRCQGLRRDRLPATAGGPPSADAAA